jgi:hypothetical protein
MKNGIDLDAPDDVVTEENGAHVAISHTSAIQYGANVSPCQFARRRKRARLPRAAQTISSCLFCMHL